MTPFRWKGFCIDNLTIMSYTGVSDILNQQGDVQMKNNHTRKAPQRKAPLAGAAESWRTRVMVGLGVLGSAVGLFFLGAEDGLRLIVSAPWQIVSALLFLISLFVLAVIILDEIQRRHHRRYQSDIEVLLAHVQYNQILDLRDRFYDLQTPGQEKSSPFQREVWRYLDHLARKYQPRSEA